MIFDEAHQLPETATLFFGTSVSTSQMVYLAHDARLESVAAAKDYAPLPEAARGLERAARDLRLVFDEDAGRWPARNVEGRAEFGEKLAAAVEELYRLSAELGSQAERGEGLARCRDRALARSACSAR